MRPPRWVMALAFLAGATAIALLSHLRLTTTAPAPRGSTTEPAANLGPLPLALPEEPLRPARLSGQIESAGTDIPASAASSADGETSAANAPPCGPPPLGDDPWRPSTRMASYQTPAGGDRSSRPAKSATAVKAAPSAAKGANDAKEAVFLTHRIVDGDTLSGLAERYLGSSKRFKEIFDANRDQLPSPDLLPIGVALRIPSQVCTAAVQTQ